jgi:hypothetical protein
LKGDNLGCRDYRLSNFHPYTFPFKTFYSFFLILNLFTPAAEKPRLPAGRQGLCPWGSTFHKPVYSLLFQR